MKKIWRKTNLFMTCIALGVDPGIRSTGYGLIKISNNNDFSFIDSDTIKPPKEQSIQARLSFIFNGISDIISSYSPDIIGIEKLFAGQNINSAITLAYSRSAILISAGLNNIPLMEYSPTKVKKYLSGYGLASKDQISFIISRLLRISKKLESDESDSLAIAFCTALDYINEKRKEILK